MFFSFSSTVKRTSRPCQGYHVDRADDATFRLYVVDNKIIVSCSNEDRYEAIKEGWDGCAVYSSSHSRRIGRVYMYVCAGDEQYLIKARISLHVYVSFFIFFLFYWIFYPSSPFPGPSHTSTSTSSFHSFIILYQQ